MDKEIDEYCNKILVVLMIENATNEKIRFNELYRLLNKTYKNKISKPTLIEHLNHLIKNQIIIRTKEAKQNISYSLNWKKLKVLKEIKDTYKIKLAQLQNDIKTFKSKTLEQQTAFATLMIYIGELHWLKLQILDIIEPKNKLQNHYTYTLIREYFNLYPTKLVESCKPSKENCQKTLQLIDEAIEKLKETIFETNPETTQQQTEQQP